MLNWYLTNVSAHPFLMAMGQFAILGTLGEFVSKWLIKGKIHNPFKPYEILWKMFVWAILSVLIKSAFIGIQGFVDALINHTKTIMVNGVANTVADPLLPLACKTGIARAFAVSTLVNLQFGLFMILAHRILDNLILKNKNWGGLHKGMISLLWFWIPAHTVTFSLPKPYQIGLAAAWSVALGIILGLFNKPNKK